MRILICGSREWTDREKIAQQLRLLRIFIEASYWKGGRPYDKGTVIHGACRGADRIAGEEAKKLNFNVDEYPADWAQGRHAGVVRNQAMIDEGRPDFALAFHSDLESSRGTRDMVRRLREHSIPVEVIS